MLRQSRQVFAILSVIAVFVLLTIGCQTKEPERLPDEVTVQLKWYHQAQFAGFYAADQNGYYAAEGLSVKFVEGGPKVDLLSSVLDGTAQFTVGLVVDSLIELQEIMVKSMGEYMGEIKGLAGVSILGDGQVVLILDVPSQILYSLKAADEQRGESTAEETPGEDKVLVEAA